MKLPRIRITESARPITEKVLSRVERRFGITLPKAYRGFLLKHNGGRPSPSVFHFGRGPYTDSNVEWFLSIYRGKYNNFEHHYKFMKIDNVWLPDELVPIGTDAFGGSICIAVSGKDAGAVFWRDNEGFPEEPGTPLREWETIRRVAKSFPEFLKGLKDE